jgi:DNA polymerase-3 subunit chi
MMEVSFYHLTKTPLDKTLPRLLEKVVASHLRAVVLTDSQERLQALDSLLWAYSQLSFLPHGTHKDGHSAHQPIWLTTTLENPNNAQVLVITDGSQVDTFDSFHSCLDLFNGLDEDEVAKTRERWKYYKHLGHTVTYWRQDDAGQWQKM